MKSLSLSLALPSSVKSSGVSECYWPCGCNWPGRCGGGPTVRAVDAGGLAKAFARKL